jgi:uncharacterized protein (DUF58 family)
MIYPTARAVGLAAIGAPVAAVVALIAPHYWLAGPAWLALTFALVMIDAGLGAFPGQARISLTAPASMPAGSNGEALVQVAFERGGAPAWVELALETCDRIVVEPPRGRANLAERIARARFALRPVRRGRGVLARVWVRWRGALGLVWKQRAETLDRAVLLTLDIQSVKDEAMRLFSRDTPAGARMQRDLGGGSEFHALRDFQIGMDQRQIDWKRSARHGALLVKEHRVERNHPVMLALDCGRLMCEPLAGLPRIDHALNAALLLAYVGLKTGDRVGLFGFGARQTVASGLLSGTGAFAHIQRLAALIDYSPEETNYTLGLTALSAQLGRRSLVVVFTEFADMTSAELMLDNVGRLLRRHLVIFVVLRDEELDSMERQPPESPEDVSRAAVAAALLHERELVVERLRRLGVHVVDAPAERIGPALLSRYLELKRRDLL